MRFSRTLLVVTATGIAAVVSSCRDIVAPPPVATISLSDYSAELVPSETALITATPKEATGTPLIRLMTWSTSEPAVATVENGLITARGIGTATVTVESEGIKAVVSVLVEDGGIIMPSGGLISGLSGMVRIDVPSAAVSQASKITISQPQLATASSRLIPGSAVSLQTQTSLSQPAILSIRYDPDRILGSPESGLRLYQATSTDWQPVPGSTVDRTARTVEGKITTGGVYGILAQAQVASVVVSPANPRLIAGDSASFTALVKDDQGNQLDGRAVGWTSSAPEVLQIDAASGAAAAKSPGSAVVTATVEGKPGSTTVSVTPGPAAQIAVLAGDGQSADTSNAVAVAPSVKVTDQFGFAIAGVTVTFSVGTGGGSIVPESAVTSADGVASSDTWILGRVAGLNTVTAMTLGAPPLTFSATATEPPLVATTIAIAAGDKQSALPFSAVPIRPSVLVTTAKGQPVPGFVVTFSIQTGGGTLTGEVARTDSAGVAAVGSWKLGQPGSNSLNATATGLSGSPVVFVATSTSPVDSTSLGPPVAMAIFAGDGQAAAAGSPVAVAPAVKVTNSRGNGVVGAVVTFSVRSGGGSISGEVATTNSLGIATLGRWVLGPPGGQSLFATESGLSGSPLIFVATANSSPTDSTSSGPAVAMAIFAGDGQNVAAFSRVPVPPAVKVTDAAGVGVPGIVVTFSLRSGGGSISGEVATTNSQGIATLGQWTLGSVGGQSIFATRAGLNGSPLIFTAMATAGVRIITFGDSNTDAGWSGNTPSAVATSYISVEGPRSPPNANNPTQLAGKIEAKWRAASTVSIAAINHGLSGTGSGPGRSTLGAPNARETVGGVTRFEGEVLGKAFPWDGGETGPTYPLGSIKRVAAFVPGPDDFVYVSMGTNDSNAGLTAEQSAVNINWMIDQWLAAGHQIDHFILTTLAPRPDTFGAIVLDNLQIRQIAASRGVLLVDIAQRTSDDNGLTWRSSADHIGDQLHYSEGVRDWIATQVVAYLLTKAPH